MKYKIIEYKELRIMIIPFKYYYSVFSRKKMDTLIKSYITKDAKKENVDFIHMCRYNVMFDSKMNIVHELEERRIMPFKWMEASVSDVRSYIDSIELKRKFELL